MKVEGDILLLKPLGISDIGLMNIPILAYEAKMWNLILTYFLMKEADRCGS